MEYLNPPVDQEQQAKAWKRMERNIVVNGLHTVCEHVAQLRNRLTGAGQNGN